MTVDEILASDRYTDRRGREWVRWYSPDEWRDKSKRRAPFGRFPTVSTLEMRLLTERDRHQSECEGLRTCTNHPVPHVVALQFSGAKWGHGFGVYRPGFGGCEDWVNDLPGAMNTARALAVGE